MAWLMPAVVLAAEPSTPAKPPDDKPPARAARPVPTLSLSDTAVQEIVRANAVAQAKQVSSQPQAHDPSASKLPPLPFRAPRRVHHHECSLSECVAYAADGTALFTFPRDQMLHGNSDDRLDGWLSCQQNDDLLSTFERYDKCRGITVGLPPVQFGNVPVKLPPLRL
jgi:hypothetical protein